ncbi:hypothetical protein SAMN02800692_1997 [Luteibacter sp. UNC138MFCol5.1]|uniref:hypothetical protein n=1 Tax=Luteibacter sp. UNC138MFCol5.1 TaxID=1502774 RepID=UPI0008B3FD59|nr:hypothetical protein [Luteibacter sp. UNC138MFCol5.1]SEO76418.1 hypothetical protein SAMN02800692_1997 [Luteibacter sp. UNC138MFCol5.1]
MATVTLRNNRLGDLIVGDVIIPRDGGTAEIDVEALKEAKKNPAVKEWFKYGWLVSSKEDKPETGGGASGAGAGSSSGSSGSHSNSGAGSNGGSGSGSST